MNDNGKRVCVVVGTRPEAIKMAPVVHELSNRIGRKSVLLISTGQHKEMLKQVWDAFELTPDIDFKIQKENQTPESVASEVLVKLGGVLREITPECILVHGDTTTCLASGIAGFYSGIPIGHVEAGLRTYDLKRPWPEEMHRRLVDPICRWCFSPTENAAKNLLGERIESTNIYTTGNTAVDALLWMKGKIDKSNYSPESIDPEILCGKKLILVTGHRRESFGRPMEEVCEAILKISEVNDKVVVVWPVHLNPNVGKPVRSILKKSQNVFLIDPVGYQEMIYLMSKSYFILTDSGGIQEEAPVLGKPVLITREKTERPEVIEEGAAKLVGTTGKAVYSAMEELIGGGDVYKSMAKQRSIFGDGSASQKIVDVLIKDLSLDEKK